MSLHELINIEIDGQVKAHSDIEGNKRAGLLGLEAAEADQEGSAQLVGRPLVGCAVQEQN